MMWRFGVYLSLVFWLSACSVVPERRVEEYQLAAMQSLQQQKRWSLEGRLALTDEKDSVSVSIVWRHEENQDDIELVGPLAQGRVKIAVTVDQVVVDDGGNRKVFYGQPDEVVAEQLSVDMPVSALRFWVLGVNDPKHSFVEQPNGFYQDGWLIKYPEMQQSNAGSLPKKMTAQKNKTRIKLIVDQWDLS